MSGKELRGIWRRAYVDLHAAYLGVLQIRHARRRDAAAEAGKDMAIEDPFGFADPAGADAVKKWAGLWETHGGGTEGARVMGAATEALRDHWDSWADLIKAYASAFQDLPPVVPSDSMMTTTAASRENLLERARILKKAWEAQ